MAPTDISDDPAVRRWFDSAHLDELPPEELASGHIDHPLVYETPPPKTSEPDLTPQSS